MTNLEWLHSLEPHELIEWFAAEHADTRAERTCEVERRDSLWGGYTEHCGADLGCDTRNTQNYCPNCGRKVER